MNRQFIRLSIIRTLKTDVSSTACQLPQKRLPTGPAVVAATSVGSGHSDEGLIIQTQSKGNDAVDCHTVNLAAATSRKFVLPEKPGKDASAATTSL